MTKIEYRQGERPLHEYLRLHARQTPEKIALVWYGNEITYAQLDAWSDGFAQCLKERGVGKGDPVILFMQNCPQYLIAHFGIQKLGAIVSPCSPLFKAREFAYQAGDAAARVIVVADDLVPIVQQTRDQVAIEHVFVVGYGDLLPDVPLFNVPPEMQKQRELPVGVIDFMAAVKAAPAFAAPGDLSMDDVALMTYTSGTTGMPKGAMLTYRNAIFKTAAGADTFGLQKGDVILAVAPLYHIAGMICGLTLLAYTGATVVLMNRLDPLAILQAIERCRVTWWYSMAPMLVAVMKVPEARAFDLSSLKTTMSTSFGIKLTRELAEQWSQFANGCLVYEAGYGLSETHTNDVIMPRDAVRWGTNGKPAPGVEVRIIDPATGKLQPVGEHGEIVLRSDGVFKGYCNRHEATAEVLRDGWVYTGDIGFMDADGYLTFIGRTKEMIKVSGYSVFPEEVEAIMIHHPDVAQVAVIGVPDAAKGEVIKAFVVLKEAAGENYHGDRIISWCKQNMSHYKVPKALEFRRHLPATPAGKVLRRLLKDEGLTRAA